MSTATDTTSRSIDSLIEEGDAFARLSGLARPTPEPTRRDPERLDVIVIGAGQAGLSVGYYLKQRGLRFVILDQGERIGDVWRKRWDSLRLFTPARYDALVGLPFPAPPDAFPTKDEMADYLESYAAHFQLPVRCGVRVERVSRTGDGYRVQAGGRELHADHVVVAMANYQRPKVPELATRLDPGIVQLHSSEYKSPAQLQEGAVLIAGAGNSGSELALESSRRHRVTMSGRDVGQVPFRIRSWLGRKLLVRLVLRVVFHRILTIATPMGRAARPKILSQGGPLIRTRRSDLVAAGVECAGRTVDVRDGKPVLDDGRQLDVRNVIWCTGFHPGFSWIDLPVFGEDGLPRHTRGVADGEPGLYFVGLNFQYAMSSTMIHGVGRDASFTVDTIARRHATRASRPAEQPTLAVAHGA